MILLDRHDVSLENDLSERPFGSPVTGSLIRDSVFKSVPLSVLWLSLPVSNVAFISQSQLWLARVTQPSHDNANILILFLFFVVADKYLDELIPQWKIQLIAIIKRDLIILMAFRVWVVQRTRLIFSRNTHTHSRFSYLCSPLANFLEVCIPTGCFFPPRDVIFIIIII